MIFISALIRQNPKLAAQWCLALRDLDEEARVDIGWAFHNAQIGASRVCVESGLGLSVSLVNSILTSERFDPIAQPAEVPVEVDALWAEFFATGNINAIERIIDVLALPDPVDHAEAIELAMLKGMIRWSLIRNAQIHPKVLELLQKRQAHEKGLALHEINEILLRITVHEPLQ